MKQYTLLLGSNLGDARQNIDIALHELAQDIGDVSIKSSLYQSSSWGYESENLFLNQVIQIKSALEPFDMLRMIKRIEKRMGRIKIGDSYSDRIIDIDILFQEDLEIKTAELQIPHAEICNRMFALAPLNEIMPDFMHPVVQKPIHEIVLECQDSNPVEILN